MGAFSSSYRPTISGGKPNSRVAWGLARLKAFVSKGHDYIFFSDDKNESSRYIAYFDDFSYNNIPSWAYYLKYQADRMKYVNNIFDIINWDYCNKILSILK